MRPKGTDANQPAQRGLRALDGRKMTVRAVLDTHLRLNLDDLGSGTAAALRARYTHDNPEFFKKRAMGVWTGDIDPKIRSWRIEDGWLLLPRGVLSEVRKILDGRKMEMRPIWDRTVKHEEVDLRLKKDLYPFQERAVDDLLLTTGGVLKGPCGGGKTVCMIGAIARLRQPVLIVVHTRELMRQWETRIAEFLGVTAGTIGGGKEENIRPVTVATQQTLWRHMGKSPPHWVDQFGLIVTDECHHVPARTHNAVAEMFPARWRWGCSATIKRKDGKEYLLHETFGPVAHEITKEELVELDRLVSVRMEVVPTNYFDEEYAASRDANEIPDWMGMVTRLVNDDDRNALILEKVREIASVRDSRILMLTERVEACFDWHQRLGKVGIRAGVMVGGAENKKMLEKTIDGLRAGKIKVGIGTKVADEGLDVPNLTHVILTCPVHQHPKRLTQMVGRAARKHGSRKKEGVAVYFWDRKLWPRYSDDDGKRRRERKLKKFFNGLRTVCSDLEVVE